MSLLGLPVEILAEIMALLDDKDWISCRQVCRATSTASSQRECEMRRNRLTVAGLVLPLLSIDRLRRAATLVLYDKNKNSGAYIIAKPLVRPRNSIIRLEPQKKDDVLYSQMRPNNGLDEVYLIPKKDMRYHESGRWTYDQHLQNATIIVSGEYPLVDDQIVNRCRFILAWLSQNKSFVEKVWERYFKSFLIFRNYDSFKQILKEAQKHNCFIGIDRHSPYLSEQDERCLFLLRKPCKPNKK